MDGEFDEWAEMARLVSGSVPFSHRSYNNKYVVQSALQPLQICSQAGAWAGTDLGWQEPRPRNWLDESGPAEASPTRRTASLSGSAWLVGRNLDHSWSRSWSELFLVHPLGLKEMAEFLL